MHAKLQESPLQAIFNTLEASTPKGHEKRGSFTGWTDDVISILSQYPQKKDHQHPAVSRETSPEPKHDFKPFKTMSDMSDRTGLKGFRIKKEGSSYSVKNSSEMSKRPFEKSIRKGTLDGSEKGGIKEGLEVEVEGYTPKVGSSNILKRPYIKDVQGLKGLRITRELTTPEGSPLNSNAIEDKTANNFYPKLKPKQIAAKSKDIQSVTVVFMNEMNNKPTKPSARKRDLSMSFRKEGMQEDEFMRIDTQSQLHNKTRGAEQESYRLDTSEVCSPHKSSQSQDKKKISTMKSFNNANLKFARKNYMGMSVLSTASKETHIKQKSLIDKIPLDTTVSPSGETLITDESMHIQAFRQYLERITRPNKNPVGLFKEKLYSAYGVSNDSKIAKQDNSDKKTPVHKSQKSGSIPAMSYLTKNVKENSGKKMGIESPKYLYTYEEIMIGNSRVSPSPPPKEIVPKEIVTRAKYTPDLVLQEGQYDDWR